MSKNKDKYKYLLDLADSYLFEIKQLQNLQYKSWNDLRQERIEYLNKKVEEILADYERLHMRDRERNRW
ncbi:MAG: hypothetical protein JHC30_06295 [Caldisericum sp.]|nr:hypothetical protein [Caldisericum sp.]